MNYNKQFNAAGEPKAVLPPEDPATGRSPGDQDDGTVYIYTEELELAVNVALATGRPLLLRGPSGAGKSSLAKNVAYILGWRYYHTVISSRTQAQDLLWRFDNVLRLSEALDAGKNVAPDAAYIQPGVLWWAFDPASAKRRGSDNPTVPALPDPTLLSPDAARAVVLIDEIDKADPDVPNNLLVPLGSFMFHVPELRVTVKTVTRPLIVITTNDERELPNAFIRRCVVTTLPRPTAKKLFEIAVRHFGPDRYSLYEPIAAILEQVAVAKERRNQHAPSTAEYLDAIAACMELGIVPGTSVEWEAVVSALFNKPRTGDDPTK
ncbi:MAG TPA: MoxR family ATPase [Thermoanaerobaculia bacterium]